MVRIGKWMVSITSGTPVWADVTISDGATATSAAETTIAHDIDSTTSVTLDDARWINALGNLDEFYVGKDGDAAINVFNGSSVQTDSRALIAAGADSQSAVVVSGPSSQW